MITEENLELVKKEILDRSDEIDPEDGHDWESMILGWALGKGMDMNEAKEFASHVYWKVD